MLQFPRFQGFKYLNFKNLIKLFLRRPDLQVVSISFPKWRPLIYEKILLSTETSLAKLRLKHNRVKQEIGPGSHIIKIGVGKKRGGAEYIKKRLIKAV